MELALNLAWIVLTALMVGLWVRFAPHEGSSRRGQLVALALVILILFPVISVTDDLMTAQNPAETDCCQRKGHVCAIAQHTLHPSAALILPAFSGFSSGSFQSAAQGYLSTPLVKVPAMGSIQNRPPPTA
jgi:hypothetical protein